LSPLLFSLISTRSSIFCRYPTGDVARHKSWKTKSFRNFGPPRTTHSSGQLLAAIYDSAAGA
jgi:hypothetical protein